ncbi:MAG: tRNA (5-methylaminomethyl-2-thiouridine)(34)-methyltransferase MnmD [Saprospiraceae bacterium]|nr:tRNA (5-methylaminomethyl-2-thiouridine)(34)-methyltransferase MnmD [Saprospiraceae bacterium]
MKEDQIFETQDGSHSIFSEKYGVSYHSKYGAIQESQHVFIEAGLYHKGLEKKEISILEIGFGTGLNAYMTLLESQKRNFHIDYTAVEAYPIALAEAQQLNYPELLGESDRTIYMQLHELPWGEKANLSSTFSITKWKKEFQELDFENTFDIIYFDAFAPSAQPELWEEEVLEIMYKALRPGGVWVSYCAKGAVKRQLKALGFSVEALQGPPGKREMTRAQK